MCDYMTPTELAEWKARLDLVSHAVVPWHESPVGFHMAAEGIHV